MSKYQEAKETIMSNYPPENYTTLREALNLAMSLLDKETPKKPTKDTEDNVRWKYYCPSCGERLNTLEKQRRCQGTSYYVPRYDEYGCGQKIDWNEEE